MAVEKLGKRSKAKSRSEDTSMVVDEPAAPQETSAKKHKKSKKADHSSETTVPPAVTDVPSPEKPKKKRKHDQPTPSEPSDAAQGDEQADAAANTSDAPRKKKRKHAQAEAEVSMEAADAEPRKRKKRKSGAPAEPHGESAPPVGTADEADEADEDGEDVGDKPKKKYPHPAKDESLSEQAVKALSYAYTYHKHRDVWKFSKAHQNWLIRHCWSTTEIPDDYIPLLKKYLKNLQGGARERLLETCQSILAAAEAPEEPEEAAAPAREEAESAEGDAESPSKSVRFAAATKETDATTKTGAAAKKSTRPPESKVKRAKAFVKVLSS